MCKEEQNMTEKKLIRMTPTQAELLTKKAAEIGLNESAYIRYLIIGNQMQHPAVLRSLYQMNYQMNEVANTIGEIADRFNSKLYRVEDMQVIQQNVQEIQNNIRTLMKECM